MLWFCSEPHHRSNQHSLMSDGLIKEEEERIPGLACAADCTKGQTHDVVLSILEQMRYKQCHRLLAKMYAL